MTSVVDKGAVLAGNRRLQPAAHELQGRLEDYALTGDCKTAALVSRLGVIEARFAISHPAMVEAQASSQ